MSMPLPIRPFAVLVALVAASPSSPADWSLWGGPHRRRLLGDSHSRRHSVHDVSARKCIWSARRRTRLFSLIAIGHTTFLELRWATTLYRQGLLLFIPAAIVVPALMIY